MDTARVRIPARNVASRVYTCGIRVTGIGYIDRGYTPILVSQKAVIDITRIQVNSCDLALGIYSGGLRRGRIGSVKDYYASIRLP